MTTTSDIILIQNQRQNCITFRFNLTHSDTLISLAEDLHQHFFSIRSDTLYTHENTPLILNLHIFAYKPTTLDQNDVVLLRGALQHYKELGFKIVLTLPPQSLNLIPLLPLTYIVDSLAHTSSKTSFTIAKDEFFINASTCRPLQHIHLDTYVSNAFREKKDWTHLSISYEKLIELGTLPHLPFDYTDFIVDRSNKANAP